MPSFFIFAWSFVVWLVIALFVFAPAGADILEAHAHGGYVTTAGFLRVVFATIATWVIAMAYLGVVKTLVSNDDIIIMSISLTPWSFFGAVKFSKYGHFGSSEKTQVTSLIVFIWVTTFLKLWW